MANNPYKNKVVYNGATLIDLTADTVTPDKLLAGYTAHDASGAPIQGSFDPALTIDASAVATYDSSKEAIVFS